VLDFAAIGDVDYTAAGVLKRVTELLGKRDVRFAVSSVLGPVRKELDRYGINAALGPGAYYETPGEALEAFQAAPLPPALPGATAGARVGSADLGDQLVFLNDVALGHVELGDGAALLGEDGDLHLHRLEDDESVAVIDVVALGDQHLPHVRDHLRADFRHSSLLFSGPLLVGAY
jgi:STAS domain